ncbi:MAG: hypothetical protein RLY71_4558 [Pseudomonadota bacterium]|jgi:hypothetical protein
MKSAVDLFLDFWLRFDASGPPFVHPEDMPFVKQGDFELNLLPLPVNGNLSEAECVVLMLNPGLDPEDYAWEKIERFRNSIAKNLSQSHSATDHALLYLDPAFAQHPGAGYWAKARLPKRPKREQQKLRAVIEAVASRDGVSVDEAQAHVSRKVAIVQLCPYHSASMNRRDLLGRLPSCQAARKFVHGLVSSSEKLVVATRSVAEWGFTSPVNSQNLVVYPGSLGISASLSLSSMGGAAMFNRISRVGANIT